MLKNTNQPKETMRIYFDDNSGDNWFYEFKDHKHIAQSGYFIQGSRVLLSKSKTKQVLDKQTINFPFYASGIKNRKNVIHSTFLSKIFSTKI